MCSFRDKYADGYNRLLSHHGEILNKGYQAPAIGSVCMNMVTVDISGIEGVQPGDEVILFSGGISLDEITAKIDIINYEVISMKTYRAMLVNLSTQVIGL